MKILLIGTDAHLSEAKLKFGPSHAYNQVPHHAEALKLFPLNEIVFDFIIEDEPQKINVYQAAMAPAIFLNTTTVSLNKLLRGSAESQNTFFGFCGMPTFLHREHFEVSLYKNEDRHRLIDICAELGTGFQVVADQTGLVTPRVISMIINEAYCTADENIASREDIDLAMTLGTNYPQGPFAWGKMIGIKNISRLLKAVYEDTGDERYRSCKMLDREAGLQE